MIRRSPINRTEWVRHRWQNRLQTALLLSFLGGYLFLVGWLIWGSAVTVWMLGVGGALLLLAPAQSPHLFMKLSGARPLNRFQNQGLYRLTDGLAEAAQLGRPPELYLLPTGQLNAFAAGGRDEPIIAISNGLLQLLNRHEMAGVLAHEVSHLRHDDIRVMRLADLSARLTGSFSLFGQILLLLNLPLVLFAEQSINWLLVFFLIFAPQVCSLAQLGLSRVREYQADLSAASLTGDPQGLASALQKIERRAGGGLQRFLTGYRMPVWLRTHPPTQERIRRLLSLLGQGQGVGSSVCGRGNGWQIRPMPVKGGGVWPLRPVPVVIYSTPPRSHRADMRRW